MNQTISMPASDLAYLVKVDAEKNNNRYYRMIREGNAFRIEMGRVGAAPVVSKRPISLWQSTYDKKIREGYADRSPYLDVEKVRKSNRSIIQDEAVRELMNALMSYANKALDDSYSVSYSAVTDRMIDAAQDAIFQMSGADDVSVFNLELMKLFQIIPRKMKSVSEMMADTADDIPGIMEREQALLNVMKSKIQQEKRAGVQTSGKTILDELGLKIRLCSEEENTQIKRHLSSESAHLFKRAFRVNNLERDKKFSEYCDKHHIKKNDVHFYYHGSKNMNYFGILSEGLKLNPKAPITGKMFGQGIYFAPRARKSIGYTSLRGSRWAGGSDFKAYLSVYKTAYKNPMDVYEWEQKMEFFRNVLPHDALYAHAGRDLVNDEVIIYNEDQMTLQYLIELEA